MALHIKRFNCAPGVWTPITDGDVSAVLQWRSETVTGKITITQSGGDDPAVNTDHYWTLRPKTPVSINDMSIGDIIWAMPVGTATLKLEVILP
jgi:hypothetical protein